MLEEPRRHGRVPRNLFAWQRAARGLSFSTANAPLLVPLVSELRWEVRGSGHIQRDDDQHRDWRDWGSRSRGSDPGSLRDVLRAMVAWRHIAGSTRCDNHCRNEVGDFRKAVDAPPHVCEQLAYKPFADTIFVLR